MKAGDHVFVPGVVRFVRSPHSAAHNEVTISIESLYGTGPLQLTLQRHELIAATADAENWRDVCADMIRLGKDREAVAELVEHSPDAVPYIKALEALVIAFGKLPARDAFKTMVNKAWTSDHQQATNRREIEAFNSASDAFHKVIEMQGLHEAT